jgi:hypothetical protein
MPSLVKLKVGKGEPIDVENPKGTFNRFVKKEARRASRRAWKLYGEDAPKRCTRGYGD